MGRNEQSDDRWCIIRTAGPRTLPLARALSAAGIDAWTPQLVMRRRRPRSKATIEIDAPILPTFVFVRAAHLPDLRAALAARLSQFPAFSVFQHAGRVPAVTAAQIAGLRREEEIAAAAHQRIVDAEHRAIEMGQRRAHRAAMRSNARSYVLGERVRVQQPALAGMTGIVESQKGKAVVINFGGLISMTIEAWLLAPDEVQHGNNPTLGAAA